jgi:ferrous iron transport protein B
MDLIDGVFVSLGEAAANVLPDGLIESLVVDGIIAGVGGVLIFLPQIAILFFCITLLEDSGYLARAAFVMERLMRKVGLPGKAFVPMLSAHACAIPAIMATRVIESKRDRLATILTLPLMSCSARLPVYAMIAALLFGDEPGKAAMLFLGAYLLGIGAALGAAGVLKLTILRGRTSPMIIELPSYRLPTLRNALMTAFDRSKVFVRKAGTIILAISIGLWILATFPQLPDAQTAGLDEAAAGQAQLEHSIAGRLGQAVEPVFEPLGYDWRINVGVVSSFAAREVVVSTLAIVTGVGEDAAEDEGLVDTLRGLERPDGALLFTVPVALSLLVFFVLAMQCLPTQAVTKRETGSWKWALLQLGYMTALAYGAALVTYQVARLVV